MKQALDRLYAVLAFHEGRIDAQQLQDAYEACLRGEAPSLLQALSARGLLSDSDRQPLDQATERQLLKTADTLLQADGAAAIRALLHGDAAFRDNWPATADDAQRRGHYRLVETCGEGGIGRVWLARDEVLGRTVALKELKPGSGDNPTVRARFLREAQVTGRLEHPFVVPVHELHGDREPYYTMRLVRGVTLAEAITSYHERRPARPSRAAVAAANGGATPQAAGEGWDRPRLLTAFEQVCQAVAFAHASRIVHRDLKPANIVLGNFGEVFVLDWGLAKDLNVAEETAAPHADDHDDMEMTKAGQILGTPAYMSPEQASGLPERIGPASDIYSLGAILFTILTGQSPHATAERLKPADYLGRIVGGQIPRARSLRPTVPAALDAICARALALEPENRYASAQDLAEDVRRWGRGEPVSAYREPWTLRLRRWSVRHRGLTLSAAVALVAAAVAVTAFAVAAAKDSGMVRRLALKAIENRADQFRTDILIELTSVEQVAQAAVRSGRLERVVRQRGPGGPPAEEVSRLSEEWQTRLGQRPFCLALSLIDRADTGEVLLRVERAEVGAPSRVQSRLPAGSAVTRQLLADLQGGEGARFVTQRPGGLFFLIAAPVQVPDAACWLVCEVDFASLLRTMLEPTRHRDIELFLRDDAGQPLLAEKEGFASPYATTALAGLDPRLVQFFAEDAVALRQPAEEMRHLYRITPIAPENTLALVQSQPNDDVVFAMKIRYDLDQPRRYLGVILVAPYEKFLAQTAASRDFLLGLMGLIVLALSTIVLLAARLTRDQTARL